MIESINYEAVYRTAPAKPGLLITLMYALLNDNFFLILNKNFIVWFTKEYFFSSFKSRS